MHSTQSEEIACHPNAAVARPKTDGSPFASPAGPPSEPNGGTRPSARDHGGNGLMGKEPPLRILLLEDCNNDAELIRLELERGEINHISQCVSTKAEFLAAL